MKGFWACVCVSERACVQQQLNVNRTNKEERFSHINNVLEMMMIKTLLQNVHCAMTHMREKSRENKHKQFRLNSMLLSIVQDSREIHLILESKWGIFRIKLLPTSFRLMEIMLFWKTDSSVSRSNRFLLKQWKRLRNIFAAFVVSFIRPSLRIFPSTKLERLVTCTMISFQRTFSFWVWIDLIFFYVLN